MKKQSDATNRKTRQPTKQANDSTNQAIYEIQKGNK